MSTRSFEGRTAWYRRKPVLVTFLFLSIIIFLASLAGNFIPQISRDTSIHEENGRVLLAFQIITTILALIYMLLMAFRWFVNIWTHKAPKMWTISMDVIFCVSAFLLTIVFLIFGDSAIKKCAFWAGINLVLNMNELIIHLVHRSKAGEELLSG